MLGLWCIWWLSWGWVDYTGGRPTRQDERAMLSSISSEGGGCCMYANAGTALDANQPTRQLRAVLASQHANGGAAANQSQILLDLQHPACSMHFTDP